MPTRVMLGMVSFLIVALLSAAGTAGAEPPPAVTTEAAGEDAFQYPLRAGESPVDVSGIFRVPVEELMQRNGITDPGRIGTGRILTIPNAFAQEAAALRAERDRLVLEKQQVEREAADRQTVAARLANRIRALEGIEAALAAEIAAIAYWRWAAVLLAVVLLGLLAWALKVRAERIRVSRKLQSVLAENAALAAAREKYREGAAQLELRYQKLYRNGPSAENIARATSQLARTFEAGAAAIERLLANIEAERAKDERRRDAAPTWFLQPVSEFLERHRLRYRTP